ncbi:MAG TPA: hypothetical protein VEL76_22300 [Gemmataceae bacterium]|nr:hypothetical protein [Gemmataceae bacterium]
MSEETQEWFVAERTRALALVHLTRRADLVVRNAAEGIGLQFTVFITREKDPQSVRQFGVFLRGTKSAVTEAQLDKMLRPAMKSFLRSGQFPYPVCLFHFSMDDDQGYSTWVAEPAVTEAGPRLLMHEVPHCRKLDTAALDEIVAQVDRWYDAFFSQIAVRAS